jgi:hypothetical protein
MRKGPWLRKKITENFCFAKVLREFCQKLFPRRTKKTTKYDPKTFNGMEQIVNRILIVNLPKNVTRRTAKLLSTSFVYITSKTDEFSGTKLGPILFLIMVNDLQCSSGKSGIWKFVDDVTLFEGLLRNGEPSVIQSDITSVGVWATNNLMKLNAKKCKEMLICFFRNKPDLPSLSVGDQVLELVSSHKVLGLIIQDDFKWNEHIAMIVTKASKRLRVLRRGGIPPHDLITIYYALIRSILDYCCTVWHCGLPRYLSEQVEKIQKRALRIILPGRSCSEPQEMLQCPWLDIRRSELCEKTMKKIVLGGRLSCHLTLTRENGYNGYNLRNFEQLSSFKCRTDRFGNTFFPSMIKCLKTNNCC